MNLLFISGELSPLSGDSDQGRALANIGGALCSLGHKVTACVPLLRPEIVERFSFARQLSPITVTLPQGDVDVHVYYGKLPNGIEVKLLDHPELFAGRDAVTGDADEPLRQAVLARAALQLAAAESNQHDGWHIVHGVGLPGALAPWFMGSDFEELANAKTVLTVCDVQQQGRCGREWVDKLGLSPDDFTPEGFEFYGDLNLLKAGVVKADRLLLHGQAQILDACSPGEQSGGLDGVMKTRRDAMVVVTPGLDYATWNPAADASLAVRYDAEKRAGKASCKAHLQNLLGLPVRPDVPVILLAPPLGQLAAPLAAMLERVLRGEAQVIAPAGLDGALGESWESRFVKEWPRQVASLDAAQDAEVDDNLWHQALAGADLVVLDAPAGCEAELLLAALRYGALPVTPDRGAARDLVVDMSGTLDSGNGFLVRDFEPAELLAVLRRATAALRYGAPFDEALSRAMSLRCSWEDAAGTLEQIYGEILPAASPVEVEEESTE